MEQRRQAPDLDLVVVGIGGQGVQLMSKMLAQAATAEGRDVLMSSEIGGEMRGGPSLASVVIGRRARRALPILPSVGSLILMTTEYSADPLSRLRHGGWVLRNSTLVSDDDLPDGTTSLGVPVIDVARQLGSPQVAGLVMMSAYAAVTDVVSADSLVAAMEGLVPPYRRQHVESNARAIHHGHELGRQLTKEPVA